MFLRRLSAGWDQARFCATLTEMDIPHRNRLKVEAGLPMLDGSAEELRLAAAKRESEFEQFFEGQRHRFAHLWDDRSRGFWTKMAIWNAVRKKLREEMRRQGRT